MILPTDGLIIYFTVIFACGHLAHKKWIVFYSREFQSFETGICPTLHTGRLMYVGVEVSSMISGRVDMQASLSPGAVEIQTSK